MYSMTEWKVAWLKQPTVYAYSHGCLRGPLKALCMVETTVYAHFTWLFTWLLKASYTVCI